MKNNPYYKIFNEPNDTEESIIKYMNQGFEIKIDYLKEGSARVKTPSGRVLNRAKIQRLLRKLEFGNPCQIEALKALSFFRLNEIYYSGLNGL